MTLNSKPLKPNGKLEVPVEEASSPPRTTLLGTIFSPVFNFFSPATKTATPESGSPEQGGSEAEEMTKQPETVVEEMPTSTPASTGGVVLSSVAPAPLVPPPPQAPLAIPEPPVEGGRMATDMLPLTVSCYPHVSPTAPAEGTYEEDWEVFDP
uniref:CTD small phosphatase-like protein 2-A n=1 Tax=Oncorhynchus gorbuscha TaxID=8017 RepID=UPI001EAF81A2